MPPRRSSVFNAVEFGALAYGVYASVSAVVGGILALIASSVLHNQVNSFNQPAGGQSTAPDPSGAVAAVGVVLLIAGIIGFCTCVGIISKRRSEGAYDGFTTGSSVRDAISRPTVAPPPGPGDASSGPSSAGPHIPGRPGPG